ncbi:MAG: hydroxymethylglutaryl-CoA synthase [Candidatus Latescibacteria bacterium]|nr:hydroxymethylglutaryl-CoA synthase [Candidatus Latescibacterota bacterium]NIM21749.1 hydroxymethylglutaryl-CoA synthase [Candidatus Latescibacterota bacterium]NIM65887.1 hydroxymethylglutaryl-CoA synthase [Candidatus Latescibacterota bacterium]NIO02632.1 hydroxymethylglutaryl-CoA synthase [Candidatus Latescibacterota bacterium]NIO29613.1 hydroxymethylglutaryl-CoA synthase [Candidatus Latescibacterota bacterium]
MEGIVGYGAYIPRNRIKVEEIAKVWGADAPSYKKGLMLEEKSVPSPDQDVITMSVEAGRYAVKRAGVDPKEIGAIYIGSESHPYAVKPSGTVVAEALGATPDIHCADYEFACKAGSEGMFVCFGLVRAGLIKYGMGIGADTSQGAPGDALEYSASAGAAAFLFGNDGVIATVDATHSYMTDTPDFWRREYQNYPRHGGRFTGEPAYFKHTLGAARAILEKTGLTAKDFRWATFHQPNGKFPLRAGKILGFDKEQLEQGWLVPRLGNTYSGASPIGLTAILDVAEPGERILMVSYGSGAGSDAFVFTVTERIKEVQDLAPKTRDQLDNNKRYLEYGEYAKFRGKIRKIEE